jgi:hypothetical protein
MPTTIRRGSEIAPFTTWSYSRVSLQTSGATAGLVNPGLRHRIVIPQVVDPGAHYPRPLDMEAQAMTIEARIRELGNRHRQLDDQLHEAKLHPSVDSLQVRELKQRKLRLKEEIASLEQRAH